MIVKKITHKSRHRITVVIPVFSRSSLLWATEEQDWGGQLESLSLLLYCLFPTSFVRAKVCFVFVSSLQSFSMRRARTLTSVNHASEVFKNEKRYSEWCMNEIGWIIAKTWRYRNCLTPSMSLQIKGEIKELVTGSVLAAGRHARLTFAFFSMEFKELSFTKLWV